MFDFLFIFLGKSIFINSFGIIFQGFLLLAIRKLTKTKSLLWESICKNLSLFLFFESICRLIYTINIVYIGWNIPLYFKMLIVLLTAIPLFKLWIDLPEIIWKHKSAESDTRPLKKGVNIHCSV